jgi:hypothetical protein
VYPDILNIENKYSVTELNVLNFFLQLTKQRYLIFKDEFVKQGTNYYHNLVHGLLTILSYQIDKLSSQLANPEIFKAKYEKVAEDIKQFLGQFFTEIVNMLNFAVEISSSNVATVILDTLTQGSQTDKKAGLVFQSIGGLLTNENSSIYIPSESLIRLINTYFYALVNLKHMGSVDRISKGLGKMSRVIFDHESKELSKLP